MVPARRDWHGFDIRWVLSFKVFSCSLRLLVRSRRVYALRFAYCLLFSSSGTPILAKR